MEEELPIWMERWSKLVWKARIGTHLWSNEPSGPFRKAVRSSPAMTKLIFFSFFFSIGSFFFFGLFFFRVCVSLLWWLPLLLFLLVSQATALHQFLNPPVPYPHPPPCTTVVLVARCLPPLNHFLHSKKTFFLPPPRHCYCSLQATGRVFCAGFLLAGPSSSPL